MQELQSKHIVLGLTGGVACYKVAQLCRLLTKVGATVQVVMTEAAQQFITPVTMQALSGRPVFTSQWDARPENNMAHINLSRAADAIVMHQVLHFLSAELLGPVLAAFVPMVTSPMHQSLRPLQGVVRRPAA